MKSIFFISAFTVGLMATSGCKDPDPRCSLQPEAGVCNAAFERYYYDQEEKKCKAFTWGGCNGIVPFETLAECEACDCK